MTEQSKIEHAAVRESVPPSDAPPLNAGGEDVGLTVDRTNSTGVADAKRYRKRAQAAERQLDELKTTLAEREQKLAQAEQAVADAQRRERIDQALHAAGALDFDLARPMAQAAIAQSPDMEIDAVIDELKRAKPYLFRQNSAIVGSGAMSAAADDSGSPRAVQMHRAASSALETGKRSDLLRYLRLRRTHA